MSIETDLKHILTETLNVSDREVSFDRETALLGGMPEFDSMAVISILSALEERYGFDIDDDEVDASVFETVGSLSDFVQRKVRA